MRGGITRHPLKDEAGNRNLEPTVEEITQAALSHTKEPVAKSRKVNIDTSYKMAGRGFHNRAHAYGLLLVLGLTLVQ